MENITIESLNGQQCERLAHIELIARFWGVVSRADLISRFDIGEAAATRDFSHYRSLAPNNLVYDPSVRRYLWDEGSAKPLFNLAPHKTMNTLSEGFGDALQDTSRNQFAVCLHLKEPNLETVSVVTRAINRKLGLEIKYHSQTTPKGAPREIVPHSIVNTGLRWHIRGWDRKRNQFTDFVINRVSNATIIPTKPEAHELQDCDLAWVEKVKLRIVPHPKKPELHSLLIEEYAMSNEVMEVECRKALAAYLLDSWNVDSSVDAKLYGHHIFLHLSNVDEVQAVVDNMFLAPGFQN